MVMNLQSLSKSFYYNSSKIKSASTSRPTRFFQKISSSRSSNSSTSVHYFNNESLNIILSSQSEFNNENISKFINKNKLPCILSPAVNIQNDSKKEPKELSLFFDKPTLVKDVASFVGSHYELDGKSQFVGGMGENDGGVWFVSDNNDVFDTLDYWEDIRGTYNM